MNHCGLSIQNITEQRQGRDSPIPNPGYGVSGGSSLGADTSPSSVESITTHSMSILKQELGEKLNKILLFKEMATAKVEPEVVYANQNGQVSCEITSNFEDRFAFKHSSELPPPIPLKSPTLTLPRNPQIVLPTPGSPRMGSPKSAGQSPLMERKYVFNGGNDSFESATTSKESHYSVGTYKERILLHDTLRSLQIQETTKRASKIIINKFIVAVFLLSILMVLSVSILATILIMRTYYVCPPINQAHSIQDSIHRQNSASLKTGSHYSVTEVNKEPSALQDEGVHLAPMVDQDYKITISVSNNTGENDDFWTT